MNCSYRIADKEVAVFAGDLIDERMYVLSSDKNVLIIDPNTALQAQRFLEALQPESCLILLTHEHYDHIYGVNWLRQQYNCRLLCSKVCAERISDPKKNLAAHLAMQSLFFEEKKQAQMEAAIDKTYACTADEVFEEYIEFTWQGIPVRIRELPGHSPGGQVIHLGDNAVFTGDALISGADPITRLPGGSRKAYQNIAIPYLSALPEGCIIFPGHGDIAPFSGITRGS